MSVRLATHEDIKSLLVFGPTNYEKHFIDAIARRQLWVATDQMKDAILFGYLEVAICGEHRMINKDGDCEVHRYVNIQHIEMGKSREAALAFRELVKTVREWAQKQGVRDMKIEVEQGRAGIRWVFERVGFVMVGHIGLCQNFKLGKTTMG
ncbi:hypothetical protein BU23DRAFT_145939 [Bimuria novae-zelandiae CBS 107.79]|uniref:N-acetyltransferase domain-containing protein n=1 Tax=Bimuria novae-zelandiae CBS 107.79 TaxID=1447943 RepID=A0A6A5V9E4_9PLEO|nr:hypothetical protein BU23DRAFT_145939 [Bimuria novae-zelandiae CBS 107.79]